MTDDRGRHCNGDSRAAHRPRWRRRGEPLRPSARRRPRGRMVERPSRARASRRSPTSSAWTTTRSRFVPSLADAPARTEALDRVARALAAEGALTAWRDERYAVAPAIRRAAVVPARARGGALLRRAHLRGARQRPRRRARARPRCGSPAAAPTKAIDPGHARQPRRRRHRGGPDASPTRSSRKRGRKRASTPTLARGARAHGTVDIRRVQPDGLQRETIFVHDLCAARRLRARRTRMAKRSSTASSISTTAARLIANDERSRRRHRRREPRRRSIACCGTAPFDADAPTSRALVRAAPSAAAMPFG